MISFESKLLLQPDVVFNSESNGRNFSSLAAPDCEKKNNFQFFQNDVTRGRGRFCQIFFALMKALRKFYYLFFWFEVERPLDLLEIKFDFFLIWSFVLKSKIVRERA